MRSGTIAVALACLFLGGCATEYQDAGWTGGFRQNEVTPGTWRLTFSGNGYTSYETTQTYWLYRAAEFTLQKGYDGFRVAPSLRLTSFASHPAPGADRGLIKAQFYSGADGTPYLSGDITLLRGPIKTDPPRVFDAAKLKARLEPLVKALCGSNVCPHVHDYLLPSLNPPARHGEI
jgi:hypothetical protein